AIQYMTYLRNLMASQELQIAEFYFIRHAYVAAIDHANIVIREYQGAPSVKHALELAMQSYDKLHLNELADVYRQVIHYNYPST
ncbi:MAG: outer membrane protein assembly factor BamD, partial [Gammaproteobacteria bacterium]|nr:outer membrane protein assembly factor BamD [Gammaproteobacteria bacterium]